MLGSKLSPTCWMVLDRIFTSWIVHTMGGMEFRCITQRREPELHKYVRKTLDMDYERLIYVHVAWNLNSMIGYAMVVLVSRC